MGLLPSIMAYNRFTTSSNVIVESPFNISSDPVDNRIIAALGRLNLAFRTQSWKAADSQGLSPTQGHILGLLNSVSGQSLRLSEIAEGLSITSPTASDSVSVLVDKELVIKERAIDDARAIAVSLTDAGKVEASKIFGWHDFLLSSLRELSLMEQEVFFRSLVKIIRQLQSQDCISVTRMCVTCQYFHPNTYVNQPSRPHHCALVDAPFGDRHLQVNCPDHSPADSKTADRNWEVFQIYSRTAKSSVAKS